MKRIAAVSLASASVCSALASPASYSFSGTMSGTLGAQNFSNAAFLIEVTSDTALVGTNVFGDPALPVDSPSTITISGLGTAVFLGSANCSVFYNQGNEIIGFGKFNGGDYLDVQTNFGPSYDLKSSIGPYTGTALSVVGFHDIETDMGLITVDPNSVPTATFEARVVPEPSTLSAAGIGMLALMARRRRQPSPKSLGSNQSRL